MNTCTTQAMIDAARAVASAVATTPGVLKAQVDDWGTFGNFSLFVDVAPRGDVDLRLIRRVLMAETKKHRVLGAHLRSVIMPKRIYGNYRFCSPRDFVGWISDGRRFEDRGVISVNLDFIAFSPESNCFPSVQPEGPFELGSWGKPAYPACLPVHE